MLIKTGDGKEYNPFWMNAKFVTSYNVTEFNFPNTKGTFIDKREPLGSKYGLELFFQGENHIEKTNEFKISAEDKRPWQIEHPYYGVLTVQPSSLGVDNSGYNVSKLTVAVTETIERVNPETLLIPTNKISEDIGFINESIAENLKDPNKNLISNQVDEFANYTQGQISDINDAESFILKVNDAVGKVENISNDVLSGLSSVADLLAQPKNFNDKMENKIAMYVNSFVSLIKQIEGSVDDIKNLPNDFKNTFESLGAYLLSSICGTVSNPLADDYPTKRIIEETIITVLDINTSYITALDKLEIGTGGNVSDYQPNQGTLSRINNLVNYTVSNLFIIGKNAKQERSEVMLEDTDFITLAHRFYGLRTNDVTIDELISENPLGLNGLINIKKGTEIKYYI